MQLRRISLDVFLLARDGYRKKTCLGRATGLALAVLWTGLSSGQVLIDDFNDGNDDGWRRVDRAGDLPAGPGIFDASSFAYNLRSSGPAEPIASVNSVWNDLDPVFANGFLRAKVRADEDGTGVYLAMRMSTDEGGFAFYQFAAATSINAFQIHYIDEPDFEVLAEVPGMTFNVGEDWYLEGGAVGDQLSLKAWRVGDPEPDVPQIIVSDSRLVSGSIGLRADVGASFPTTALINGTFDDVLFTVPEPSTFALAGIGLLTFRRLGRKRRSSRSSGRYLGARPATIGRVRRSESKSRQA